jgi:hypothetical protein
MQGFNTTYTDNGNALITNTMVVDCIESTIEAMYNLSVYSMKYEGR